MRKQSNKLFSFLVYLSVLELEETINPNKIPF